MTLPCYSALEVVVIRPIIIKFYRVEKNTEQGGKFETIVQQENDLDLTLNAQSMNLANLVLTKAKAAV